MSRSIPAGALLSLLLFAACSTGSPSAPAPAPAPAPLGIAYTPDYKAGSASVVLRPGAQQPGRFGIVLDLEAIALPSVDGLFFDLVYPPELLEYRGFADGGFIHVASVGQPNRVPGRLRILFSDYGFPGYPPSGSGKLLELYFDPVAEGRGQLRFEGFGVIAPTTLEWKFGMLDWYGGEFVNAR